MIIIQVTKTHKGSKQAEHAALTSPGDLPDPVILEVGSPVESSSKLGLSR